MILSNLTAEQEKYIEEFKCLVNELNLDIAQLEKTNNKLNTELNSCMKEGTIILRPTYSQVIDFLEEDKTDEIIDFKCVDYATTLIRNARIKGIYACLNTIAFENNGDSQHMIISINTIDNGLIHIEPQTDEVIELKLGNQYSDIGKIIKWRSCWEEVK